MLDESVEDFHGGGHGEDTLCKPGGADDAGGADGVFDDGEVAGGDGELVDAEAEEKGGEAGVGSHLATDGDGDAVPVAF